MSKENKTIILLKILYIQSKFEKNKKKLLSAINEELINKQIKQRKNVYS